MIYRSAQGLISSMERLSASAIYAGFEIMVMQALCGVELAMRDVGVPFEPGAGAGAAVRYLSDTGQAMRIAAE